MKTDLIRGDVVRSLAGHDKDSLFVVLDTLDDQYVLIADGKSRTVEKPKKKKKKHLRAIPAFQMKIGSDAQPINADLRKFLKSCSEYIA
jgi:Ribosomal protein L14E/L6E/L27E